MDVVLKTRYSAEDIDHWERCSLHSSISTNATADDLPGPGLTLGTFYDFAGRHLEEHLGPVVQKLRKHHHTDHPSSGSPSHLSHPHHDEEDLNSDYRVQQCSLVSSISTTATADNLPGAGRILGLFYGSAGRRLELQLGRWAEKLGKGPRVTAMRIQRRRSKAINLPVDSKKHAEKNTKVKKDCKELLKYVESHVLSTRLQALDHIINLAVDDPFVRDALLFINAKRVIEPLQRMSPWVEFSPTLLDRSRRALLSLDDPEVHVLVQKIDGIVDPSAGSWWRPQSYMKQLMRYLKNPDRAFLVVRHLERLSCKMRAFHIHTMMNSIKIPDLPDGSFEWSTLDLLLSRYLRVFLDETCSGWLLQSSSLPRLMEFILRFSDKLPLSLQSEFFSSLAASDTIEEIHIYVSWCLLSGIVLANGLQEESIFKLEFSRLQKMYPHTAIHPLLRRITCPPELILCSIFAARLTVLDPVYFSYHSAAGSVVDPEKLEQVCKSLSRFIDSEDGLLRERALHALNYLLVVDIYCHRAASRALSTTRFAQTVEYVFLLNDSRKFPSDLRFGNAWLQIERHCDVDGRLIHLLGEYPNAYQCHIACRDPFGGVIQELEYGLRGVLNLMVPRGVAFSAAGHHPLLAGISIGGERVYIARPVSKDNYEGHYIAITEGTKPEELSMWDRSPSDAGTRKKVIPVFLLVFVLRYPPIAYMHGEHFALDDDGEVGLDSTGPYSWKPQDPVTNAWIIDDVDSDDDEVGTVRANINILEQEDSHVGLKLEKCGGTL